MSHDLKDKPDWGYHGSHAPRRRRKWHQTNKRTRPTPLCRARTPRRSPKRRSLPTPKRRRQLKSKSVLRKTSSRNLLLLSNLLVNKPNLYLQLGPANWADTYPQCGGTRQSPIDIDTNSVNRRYDLASLDTSSYDERFDEDQATAVLSNTGHSVQVTMKYNDRPVYSLRDGELESTYHLEQFHFHWGSNNHEGAEHTVNGRSYPMEVHFVHYRSDLDNVATAKTQEGGLVVLGALFKIGDHNENYEDIVENLSNIRYSGQTAPLRRFRPSSLLPRSLSRFYRYHGSLTTPTCDENVTWLVLHEPIYISEEQLEQFRRLYSTEEGGSDEPLSNNFRPTQPLNDRNILASFGDD